MFKNNTTLKANKNLIAFIIFFTFWFSFLCFTGTLTSGFHFTDDHQLISIKESINDNGFINAAKSFINKDLDIRFRPFYSMHRVFLVKIFGSHFFLLSIYC